MIKTAAQARALIKREGIVTLAAHIEGVPCFVEEVVGARVRGSWWGHPKGKLIFNLAEGLEDAGDVLSLKLLEGKATFVDEALWPALLAVVLDEGWRRGQARGLSEPAKTLWKMVEASSVRGAAPAAVKALESSLLVHVASEHTEKGRHEKRLTSWGHWALARRVEPAKGSVEQALKALREAANGAETGLSRGLA